MRAVVAGAGDVGVFLARELSQQGADVVLVDADANVMAAAEGEVDALTLVGDITHASVIEAGSVGKSDLFIAVTGHDHTNVVAAALAAQQGSSRAVARVDAPGFYRTTGGIEFGSFGVYAFLCASRLVSDELLRLARHAEAMFVANLAGNSMQACIVEPTDASPAVGDPAAKVPIVPGCELVAVLRDGALRRKEDIARLEADDGLLITGPPAAMAEAVLKVRGDRRRRKVVLVGGGDVGFQLARSFEASERRIQIIERDVARCQFLSEQLPDVNVVHGDGTAIACLRDQHVDTADSLLAVTRADEVNLMASLLSSELGVPRTYALVHRPGYSDVYAHLKITGTAGPHDVIGRAIRWLLPKSGALTVEPIPKTAHVLAEYVIRHDGNERALADISLPVGALIVGISRNLTYVPPVAGTLIRPNDHVVIAVPERGVAEVAQRLKRAFKRGKA